MPWYNPLSWFKSDDAPAQDDDAGGRGRRRSGVDMGADYIGNGAAAPGYSPEWAMSALSRFPWLYASVMTRAADAASLDKYLIDRRRPGERITEHPALDLIRVPSSWATGEELFRQFFVDLSLSGNAWWLEVLPPGADPGDRSALPQSLARLHPIRVKLKTDRAAPVVLGVVYTVGDGTKFYPMTQVRHVRYPSWEDGPSGLYGQGLIRALHDELRTELAATEQTRRTAENGRPDVVISPSDPGDVWDGEIREDVRDAYLDQTRRGGPLVLGGPAKVEPADWDMAELQMPELRRLTRQTIMAGTRVPPVILGQETANYATARQQEAVYWKGIRHDVRLLDAQLSRTVSRFDPFLEVRTDFGEVEALSAHRTERINRARQLVDMGATPAAALAAEGVDDVDAPDERIDPAAALGALTAGDDRAELRDVVAEVLAAALDRAQSAPPPVAIPARSRDGKSAGDRAARVLQWRAWLSRAYDPARVTLNRESRRYLGAARARYVKRVRNGLSGRVFQVAVEAYGDGGLVAVRAAVDWDEILGETAEEAEVRAVLGREWRRVWKLAAARAAGPLPVDGLTFDPDRPEVVSRISRMSRNMTRTTVNAIRAIIEDGLAEGLSVGDMQGAIAKSAAFGPSRALLVARTEATRAVNQGALGAYRAAGEKGVQIRKQWLTGGDNIRDSHLSMDGQTRAVDADFVSGDGASGSAPGDLGSAAEDCNCKCTVAPVVDGKPAPLF